MRQHLSIHAREGDCVHAERPAQHVCHMHLHAGKSPPMPHSNSWAAAKRVTLQAIRPPPPGMPKPCQRHTHTIGGALGQTGEGKARLERRRIELQRAERPRQPHNCDYSMVTPLAGPPVRQHTKAEHDCEQHARVHRAWSGAAGA